MTLTVSTNPSFGWYMVAVAGLLAPITAWRAWRVLMPARVEAKGETASADGRYIGPESR